MLAVRKILSATKFNNSSKVFLSQTPMSPTGEAKKYTVFSQYGTFKKVFDLFYKKWKGTPLENIWDMLKYKFCSHHGVS